MLEASRLLDHRRTRTGEKKVTKLTLPSLLLLVSLAIPCLSSGQTTDPGSAPPQTPEPPVASQPAAKDRPVSLKLLLPNLLNDQKRIWTFPARLAEGQALIPTAAVLGITAGPLAFHPTEPSYFPPTSPFPTLHTTLTAHA